MIHVLLAVMTAVCPCCSCISPDDLAGFWQANTCIGSGLDDVWFFMSDGTLLFRTSSMDGRSRLREFEGTWVVLDDTLRVAVTRETVVEGGSLVPKDGCGSIGTDSVVVDAVEVDRFPDPPYCRDYLIESLVQETMEENPDLPADMMRLDMDGVTYWRFTADPDAARELLDD
jgi:hypothetical protein